MSAYAIDFPDSNDPNFDPDAPFEAPNGITYTWNGYGWVAECGGAGLDDEYLKRYGDDVQDTEGDIQFYRWKDGVSFQHGDDTTPAGEETKVFLAPGFLNLQCHNGPAHLTARNSTAEVNGGDLTNIISGKDVRTTAGRHFEVFAKEDAVIKAGLSSTEDGDVRLEATGGGELVERTIDDTDVPKQITNKEYVDAVTNQLHQDIISLDEEIESIARSSEKGFWRYAEPTSETRPPSPGRFFLLKNYSPNTGGVGASFTQQYSEANAAVFHNIEWNVDEPTGVGGEEHTWADVEVGHLLDILDKPDPDGLFGKITDVDLTAHPGTAVIIAFDTIEYLGSPTNNSPFQSLLKVFKEPEGGSADEFVRKEGNAGGHMTGDLTLNTTNDTQVYSPSSVDAKLTFKNETSSNNTSYINLFKTGSGGLLMCDNNFGTFGNLILGEGKNIHAKKANGDDLLGTIWFTTGWMVHKWNGNDRFAIQSEGGSLKYDSRKQLTWTASGGSLQYNNNNVLNWASTTITAKKQFIVDADKDSAGNGIGFRIKGTPSSGYGSTPGSGTDLLKVDHVASYADHIFYYGRVTADKDIATKEYVDSNVNGNVINGNWNGNNSSKITITKSNGVYYITGG